MWPISHWDMKWQKEETFSNFLENSTSLILYGKQWIDSDYILFDHIGELKCLEKLFLDDFKISQNKFFDIFSLSPTLRLLDLSRSTISFSNWFFQKFRTIYKSLFSFWCLVLWYRHFFHFLNLLSFVFFISLETFLTLPSRSGHFMTYRKMSFFCVWIIKWPKRKTDNSYLVIRM